jgi:hypothetical protein
MNLRPLLLIAVFALPCLAEAQSHVERHHPDVTFRQQGLAALDRGEAREAFEAFERAAYFADKASQALVAEMYWAGQGVSQDRARAYVWMDLAAERGYPLLLGKRELYWQQLTAAEQGRALAEGPAVFAEYSDDVAKPRLEDELRAGLMQSPGSRVGASSAFVQVITNIARGPVGTLQGVKRPQYYSPKVWNPHYYWAQTDLPWHQPLEGLVEVKPLSPSRP